MSENSAVVDTTGADFILASASPRRRALLAASGLHFVCAPVALDESPRAGERAQELVLRLARAKAQRAAELADGARVVLGADTVVVLGARVLGKPRDAAHALAMLTQLAGRTHEVWTGVALATPASARVETLSVSSRVTLRRASESELRAYIAGGEPHGKAGAYALQGEGARFVERVEGSRSNVIGLPLDETLALLANAGVRAPDAQALHADISARLARVRARVASALARAGREPADVTLTGVSKSQTPGAIFFAALKGVRDVGENYAQELHAKAPAVTSLLADAGAQPAAPRWRFIGQLQRNKVRLVAPVAACVESVDRESLARELDQRAREAGRTLDVLLQVQLDEKVLNAQAGAKFKQQAFKKSNAQTPPHLTRHPAAARGGAAPETLPALCDAVARCNNLRLRGLMTLPAPLGPEHARRVFAQLFELRNTLGARALPELSMGSSADFELAIAEGASIIRVGTAIFGPRRTP